MNFSNHFRQRVKKEELTNSSTNIDVTSATSSEEKGNEQIIRRNGFVQDYGRSVPNTAPKVKPVEIVVKSDKNNNQKSNWLVEVNPRNSFESAFSRKSRSLDDEFGMQERDFLDEETGSEKSFDVGQIRETVPVSWLEVHEKTNRCNDDLDATSESNRRTASTSHSSNMNKIVERACNVSLKALEGVSIITEIPSQSQSPDTLSVDVKVALLQTLNAIDSELE